MSNLIINEFGLRQDARKPAQIRNVSHRMGVSPRADGSVYYEQGGTKVLCAVYGPQECRFRSRMNEEQCLVNCQYSQATFALPDRRNRPRGDRRGNNYGRLLERTFENAIITNTYPRGQIDIFCEVLESDGGNLAACVNAASLALADAGIAMRGLVASVECGTVDGTPFADMNAREYSEVVPRITVATLGGKEEIVLVDMTNIVHKSHIDGLLRMGLVSCSQVHACLQTAVLSRVREAHKIDERSMTSD